jgi:hypothetical protein
MKAGIKGPNKNKFKKAQNFTELALIIGVLGIVLLGMEIYIKRGVSGKIKDLTDHIISADQKTYSTDTSGLEINESGSDLSLFSTTAESTSRGGAASVQGTEVSRTISSSTSLDEP